MTKDFKEIEIIVNGKNKGTNLKAGIEYARKVNCDMIQFKWQENRRLDDNVFVQRLQKILPTLLNRDSDILTYETGVHTLAVSNIL